MVEASYVDCPVKVNDKEVVVPWPLLHLSSWLQFILRKTDARMLCSGISLGDEWAFELKSFWSLYQTVQPDHQVFTWPKERLAWTVPMLYHGDEGRGKNHRQVLVVSYQPLLAMPGHTFKSRLLCSVFPGEKYACKDGQETLEALHHAMALDLIHLFEDGLQVLY